MLKNGTSTVIISTTAIRISTSMTGFGTHGIIQTRIFIAHCLEFWIFHQSDIADDMVMHLRM
jgi:hypothetical protein